MAASQPVVMPKLGLTMTEGILAEWRIAPGDTVKAGDVIFVVETDKISNDIEAAADAIVEALHVAVGDVVPVGALVATFRSDEAVQDAAQLGAPADVELTPAVRIIATPLARRIASQARLDLRSISGSGPRGRIMADDVSAAINSSSRSATAPSCGTSSPSKAAAEAPARLRALRPYQKVAARRLVEAKRDIPHFYVLAEADVTELLSVRQRLNSDTAYRKVTVNHFILTAVARALMALPEMNCIWADDALLDLVEIGVGLAVEGPKGLIAPVLHDLRDPDLDSVAAAASDLVDRARAGRLTAAELTGGAISVSNVGMFGATGLIPIVNPGQTAILGVGRDVGQFRPDRVGQPVLRHILNLALSCDHRVIDGALAARFLREVQNGLEAPLSLLRRPAQGPAS